MATSDAERLAARARAEGRLGLDTEFMPEGRYRPLLCLVQIVVGDEIAVLDPLEGVRAGAARRRARRPGRRDRRPRRPPGRRDPAPAVGHDVHQRVRHAGRRRVRRLLGAGGLQRAPARRPADPAAEDGQLHPLGRAPAHRRAGALRPRRRGAPAAAGGRDRRAADREGAARVGARGVPRDRGRHGRARPGRGLAAAPAGHQPRSARPRRGARARGLAGAHGGARGPAGRLRGARPDGGRAGEAPARGPARAVADPGHQPGRHPPPRRGHPGGDRARAQRRAGAARRGRPARHGVASTAR